MPDAPVFVTIDPIADLEAVVAHYESLVGRGLSPAAAERLILNAIAYRWTLANQAIQDAAEQNLVDFARAPALDYLGIFFGVTRLAAAAASAEITFTLFAGHGGVTIPAGTRIGTADGKVIFTTIEDINVPALTTVIAGDTECTVTGTVGNGYTAGTVTNILDPQPFLDTATNLATTSGGADTEEDDALRVRIKAAPAAFSVAGSRKAYRYHALSASALLSDVAVPDTAGDGIVNIYPLMADGTTTPAGILTAVDDAVSGETVRPLSDTPVVIAPTAVNYDIELEITCYLTANFSAVETAVNDALVEWSTNKRQLLGQDITDTQIFNVMHNAAPDLIYDAELILWTDVVISEIEYGFLNTLTVTVVGAVAG